DFSIVGDSTFALPARQSKEFVVRFTPSAEAHRDCFLGIVPAPGTTVSCLSPEVMGTGSAPPVCQVMPSGEFGDVTVGHTVSRVFTITNTGGGTLTGYVAAECSGFALHGGGAYSLTAGQSFMFTLDFTPPSAGSFDCMVDLEFLGGSGCPSLAAHGTGVP